MDFLGGALPNVMFIVGMLAIGLGLGIELKLVPLNKEIDKTGRIGAIVVGTVLVAASLYIYLNPSLANRNQASPSAANAALVPVAAAPTAVVPPPVSAPARLPTEAAVATEAPTVVASAATPAPAATSIPTAVPPTKLPSVAVPDLHGLSEKDALGMLKTAGLQGNKVDKCSGSDKGDSKTKKHQVQCQNPAANAAVSRGTTVEYVVQ